MEMKKKHFIIPLGLIFVFGLWSNAFAESYPNGVLGMKAASLPPPGKYLKNFNVFVMADEMVDKDGNDLPIGFDVLAYVNCTQYIWVTDKKFLGGDYLFDFLIPIWAADVEIAAQNQHLHGYGFGDLILEPFGLAWHGPRYDAVIAAGVIIPTGDQTLPIGTYDQWTGLISFGATAYFDDKKTWSACILNRVEFNTKDRTAQYTRGPDFHFEWGIGKSYMIEKVMLDVGAAGYCQWQIADDKGSPWVVDNITGLAAPGDKGKPDTAYGVGPEVQAFFTEHKIMVNARALIEVGVKSADAGVGRPEGTRIIVTLIKLF